jgi:molybdopterin molybdotransferase
MITVDEALEKVLAHVPPMGEERVSLLKALGRVVAEDIGAPRDIPPLDNSGMDGYAVRHDDLHQGETPVRLKGVGEIRAGVRSNRDLGKGEALRIMTGAALPPGADTVVPVEETRAEGDEVLVLAVPRRGEFVRKAGGDVRKGERVLSKGELIRPAEVGMLASIGRPWVTVSQRPRVAILCTGEELVDVGDPVDDTRIYSSNSYALAAQVSDCGAIPVQLGIARDCPEEIEARLRQGLGADVIVTSAGVSVGDYDYVKDVLKTLGMELVFWRVAMKPGKPVVFGRIGGKPVFGLPGNPVSSMVTFEQFVRPGLLKMMGCRNLGRPAVEGVLRERVRAEKGRRCFIRARVSFENGQWIATTTGDQGSGILSSMMKANGLVVIPEDQEEAPAGASVKIQLLNWNG